MTERQTRARAILLKVVTQSLRVVEPKLYMILVNQSRTSSTRHYRLLHVGESEHIEDITGIVCRAIGTEMDSEKGTYSSLRGTQRSEDASTVQQSLRTALQCERLRVKVL